ncbi:MAG: signal peptidase I [Mucilaginibacter sp.]
MNKTVIAIVCICGFVISVWIVVRLTHVLDVYRVTSSSSEPTYFPDDIIFASRFKQPDHNTYVCFKKPTQKAVLISRCIGRPGDLIEIKDAYVYRNGKLLDEPYIWNQYYILQKQLSSIPGDFGKTDRLYPINDSISTIFASDVEIKNHHLDLKQVVEARGVVNLEIYPDFKNHNYNADNLGPIIVPINSYFLLGDNRHNALDSRYIGFIKADEIVSTVIR